MRRKSARGTNLYSLKNNNIIGKESTRESEPAETYRERHIVKIHIALLQSKGIGAKTIHMPIVVATDFPPLKDKKGVYACASTATIARREIKKAEYPSYDAYKTGSAPLAISEHNVRKPHCLPHTRAILVAPIFLLPAFCKSTLQNTLAYTTPKGIEHTKAVINKSNILASILFTPKYDLYVIIYQ